MRHKCPSPICYNAPGDDKLPGNSQVPTLAPTQLPVGITVLSPSRQSGGTLWVGKQAGLQLFSPTIADQYNWSTSNTSVLPVQSCMTSAGPYLSIEPTCLMQGGTYVLRLSVRTAGIRGHAQVRASALSPLSRIIYHCDLCRVMTKRRTYQSVYWCEGGRHGG